MRFGRSLFRGANAQAVPASFRLAGFDPDFDGHRQEDAPGLVEHRTVFRLLDIEHRGGGSAALAVKSMRALSFRLGLGAGPGLCIIFLLYGFSDFAGTKPCSR